MISACEAEMCTNTCLLLSVACCCLLLLLVYTACPWHSCVKFYIRRNGYCALARARACVYVGLGCSDMTDMKSPIFRAPSLKSRATPKHQQKNISGAATDRHTPTLYILQRKTANFHIWEAVTRKYLAVLFEKWLKRLIDNENSWWLIFCQLTNRLID